MKVSLYGKDPTSENVGKTDDHEKFAADSTERSEKKPSGRKWKMENEERGKMLHYTMGMFQSKYKQSQVRLMSFVDTQLENT